MMNDGYDKDMMLPMMAMGGMNNPAGGASGMNNLAALAYMGDGLPDNMIPYMAMSSMGPGAQNRGPVLQKAHTENTLGTQSTYPTTATNNMGMNRGMNNGMNLNNLAMM